MKRFIVTILALTILVGSVFAKDAGRKYTKATINGESAKIYTDDKVEADFNTMKDSCFEMEGEFYYKYEMTSNPITRDEWDFYSKRGTWSKVEFKDRVEFFWCTRNFGPVGMKYTFITSELYTYNAVNSVSSFLGDLGNSIGRVAEQYTK